MEDKHRSKEEMFTSTLNIQNQGSWKSEETEGKRETNWQWDSQATIGHNKQEKKDKQEKRGEIERKHSDQQRGLG